MGSQSAASTRLPGASSFEFELLLACCGSGAQAADRIPRLLENVDWIGFRSLSDRHGVTMFVHQALQAHAVEVPIWSDLRDMARMQTQRALWLTEILQQVLAALQAGGVDALPYKGPVLAQTLYEDVAARQYTDLDILIRARDLGAAKAALAAIGLTPHIQLTPAEEKAYVSSGYEMTFDGFGSRNLVELQWRVLPRFYAIDLDTDRLFARAGTMDLASRSVAALCPEDLFLVLTVHAAKHLWARLGWIYDIARLTATQQIDWNDIEHAAKRLGIRRIVAVTFRLIEELFGQVPPPQFREAARGPEVQELVKQVIEILSAGEQPNTESMAYFRQALRLRERRSDRLRFLFRLATTPSVGEWETVRLPEPLFPLYRAVRFFRLLRKLTPNG